MTHPFASFSRGVDPLLVERMGRQRYPQARELTITADCGGSNGARVRLWKLDRFAANPHFFKLDSAHRVAESGKSCFAITTCADFERRPDADGGVARNGACLDGSKVGPLWRSSTAAR